MIVDLILLIVLFIFEYHYPHLIVPALLFLSCIFFYVSYVYIVS